MPVIVTDVGATLEMVDGSNGEIIDKNSVTSLKKAILNYHNLSTTERKNKSENSYKKVAAQFSWKQIAAKHAQLFESAYLRN
jgi:glycosyltransferase involved in cell wall biosynthesis